MAFGVRGQIAEYKQMHKGFNVAEERKEINSILEAVKNTKKFVRNSSLTSLSFINLVWKKFDYVWFNLYEIILIHIDSWLIMCKQKQTSSCALAQPNNAWSGSVASAGTDLSRSQVPTPKT